MEKLRQSFTSQDDLKVKLTYIHQHEGVAQKGELTTGQYIQVAAHFYKQIKYSLSQLDRNLFDLGSIQE